MRPLPGQQDVSVIQSRLAELSVAKRAMLESSAFALQEGDALLEKLSALWQLSSLDSRPGIIKQSVALAIGRVSYRMSQIQCTGISSQIRTKLRDWAVWQARAGCYSQVTLSSNDSKTRAVGSTKRGG